MVTGPPRNPRAAMDHRFAARRRRPGQLHRPHQPGCRGTTVAEGVQPLAGGAWPLFSAFFWSVLAATGPWRPRARPARRDEGRALGLAVHTPGGVEIIEMLSVSYPSRAASAPNQTHRRQHGLTINPPSFFEVGSPIQYIFPQHPKRTLRHGGHYAPNAISRSFTMARVCLELRPRPSRCVRAPNSGGRRIMRCNSARRSVVT